MQTSFNEVQLADPTIARADAILKRCVHFGLCTATCPTYVLTGMSCTQKACFAHSPYCG